MELKWKDATSYSYNDKERIPVTFELILGELRIVVTRMYNLTDTWFLHCRKLHIDSHDLRVNDLEIAKHEALKLVKDALEVQVMFANQHVEMIRKLL